LGRVGFVLLHSPAEGIGVTQADDLWCVWGGAIGGGVGGIGCGIDVGGGGGADIGAKAGIVGENAVGEFYIGEQASVAGDHAIEYSRVIAGDIFIILQDIALIVVVIFPKGGHEWRGYRAGVMEHPTAARFRQDQKGEEGKKAFEAFCCRRFVLPGDILQQACPDCPQQ
jgi:hypothetical protein